jgi:serine/threonine-protein kinase
METTEPATGVPSRTEIILTSTIEIVSLEELTIGSSFIRERDEMLVMFIPEGSFLMGSVNSDSNASADEKPQHEVYLDAYWMDAFEVSNEMFTKFIQETGYQTAAEQQGFSYMYSSSGAWAEFSGVNWRHPMGENTVADDSLPVVHINYYDAAAYCEWAGGRLPTEAEWEKAARGEDGRIYPWGNTFSSNNLRYNASGGPSSIFSFSDGQSPYGIFNMAGNVFEWTNDWYSANYYSGSPTNNPSGPSNGEYISLRSGGWNSSQSNVRIANRDISGPEYMNYLLGFRCAMDADEEINR